MTEPGASVFDPYMGVGSAVLAAVKHVSTVRRLSRGEPIQFNPITLGTVVAVVLAVLGLLVAVYLIFGLKDAG